MMLQQRQSRARATLSCMGYAWCARCAATARATALGVCGTGLAGRVEFPVAVVLVPLDARSASFVKRVDRRMAGTSAGWEVPASFRVRGQLEGVVFGSCSFLFCFGLFCRFVWRVCVLAALVITANCSCCSCPMVVMMLLFVPDTRPCLWSSVGGNAGCTFHKTGTVHAPQQWQNCVTCGLVDGLGVCVSCAATCHVGHALGPVRSTSFYCDCGGQGRCGRLLSSSSSECSDVKGHASVVTDEMTVLAH